MNITEFLDDIRERLVDAPVQSAVRAWTDTTLLRRLATAEASIFSELADGSDKYGLQRLKLSAEDAVAVQDSTFIYQIPTWVHRIIHDGVREWKGETTAGGTAIHKLGGAHDRGHGWRLEDQYTLVYQASAAKDLEVRVSKVPGPPMRGTTDRSTASNDILLLMDSASSSLDVRHDPEKGAYRGSYVQITSVPAGDSPHLVGKLLRVKGSEAVNAGNVSRIRLTMDGEWPSNIPKGSGYASLVHTPREHLPYLFDMMKASVLADRDMPMGDAMQSSLRTNLGRFMSSKERDKSSAKHFGETSPATQGRDGVNYDYTDPFYGY